MINIKNIYRHQLIYLKRNTAVDILTQHENIPEIKKYIYDWIVQELPFIFTSQINNKNNQCFHLGLSVLCNEKKYRVALQVNNDNIKKEKSLPKMAEIFSLNNFSDSNIWENFHIYGSFLFQYLSNRHFVKESSDLDILIEYNNESLLEIKKTLNILQNIIKHSIDGEIRFKNNNQAVDIAIQELLSSSTNLLAKTISAPFLLSRRELYETYPALR